MREYFIVIAIGSISAVAIFAFGTHFGNHCERSRWCQKHEIRAEYDKCMEEGAK